MINIIFVTGIVIAAAAICGILKFLATSLDGGQLLILLSLGIACMLSPFLKSFDIFHLITAVFR